MSTATVKRKLIDIQPAVFEKLSLKAGREGVSLKRYIENLLEEDSWSVDADVPEGISSPEIISLIGIAKGKASVDWEDDRLKYLLSK